MFVSGFGRGSPLDLAKNHAAFRLKSQEIFSKKSQDIFSIVELEGREASWCSKMPKVASISKL